MNDQDEALLASIGASPAGHEMGLELGLEDRYGPLLPGTDEEEEGE